MLAALLAFYLPIVYLAEQQAEEQLAELRETHPKAYLAQIRGRESFATYMRDYAEIEGFHAWNARVPNFLLGRWALFPRQQKAGVGFRPESCVDAVAFEDGRLKRSSANAAERGFTASYRIEAPVVLVRLGDGCIVRVEVAGIERRIDHIRLTPPGGGESRFAYRCE